MRGRPREVVALREITPLVEDPGVLSGVLDTLGNDLETEGPAQGNDGLDDGGALGVVAQMTPYEMYFFSSGAVESRWGRGDLTEMRVNVLLGFPLGGLLAIAIQAVAFLVFFPAGIQVEHISQTVLPVALALGKVGLVIALVGVFAATFGATLETLFATGYEIAQYAGWSYGEVQPPARAARFTTVVIAVLLGATALALTTLDPITVTIYAVVFSAMLLPFAFLPVLLVANDRTLMGDLVNGRLSNALKTATLAVSLLVSMAAFPLLVLTHAGSK